MITVPANFTSSQGQATVDAAKLAGLDVKHLLNDTTSAALAISHQKRFVQPKLHLIFDLDSYFLNLSLVKIENDDQIEVISSASFPGLGGKRVDFNMLQYVISQTKYEHLWADKEIVLTLLSACEKAKQFLSNGPVAEIEVDSLTKNKDFQFTFDRDKFDEINGNLFCQIASKVDEFLRRANLNRDQIDEIVMLGGSSRIPKLKSILAEYFGKELNFTMNASETVAHGAALLSSGQINTRRVKEKNKYKK